MASYEETLFALLFCNNSNAISQTILLHLLTVASPDEQAKRKRRYRYASLSDEERQRRQRKIPAPSLPPPIESPWYQIFHNGQDQAFITATGLDRSYFMDILCEFTPIFNAYSPYSLPEDGGFIRELPQKDGRGCPRKITAHACLALALYWTQTTCYQWSIGPFFGIVASCTSVWLRFGRRILCRILMERPEAQIRMPNGKEVADFIDAVQSKYPALTNVGYVGDGLKILFEKATDHRVQSMYYNGWKGDHYITNLFVFAPNGKIVAAVLNCPGTMHDSELATIGDPSIYNKLDKWYEDYGLKCVMDSAFCTASRQSIIKSIPRDRLLTYADDEEQAIILDQALSLRQAAEWGMRALQGSMPRLKTRWAHEERGEREISITLIALLYNYKAHYVGLNQVRNVFWR